MLILPIPIYIINLPQREDRRLHTLNQFSDKKDFSLKFISPIPDRNGAKSLWRTIQDIVQEADESEYVVICQDDHQFTNDYSMEILWNCIMEAKSLDADVLMGGISWCNNTFPVRSNMFWVDQFSGLQFAVIFRQFFSRILQASFNDYDCADYKISALTDKKFVISPFISIQRDFGYSDITSKNNTGGRVAKLFEDSSTCLSALSKVENFYSKSAVPLSIKEPNYNEITIPTYIINLPDRTDRLEHIKKEFAGRNEFDLTVVEACRHTIGAVGLWQSIRKVISLAIDNDDDVIVICEDDHEFTKDYSSEFLIKNIIEAGEQGVQYLSGGTSKFEKAVRVADNRYWISFCLATQFIVLYKSIFQAILNEPFDNTVIADQKLSGMIVNKMILYPFISMQKDFGYSDVTSVHRSEKNFVSNMFKESKQTMERILEAHKKFPRI